MLVGLLSDIHDHTTHLLLALHAAKAGGCEQLLFMGDMAGMSTFRTLREEWDGPIDMVFGNNEYERAAFITAARSWRATTLHGDSGIRSLGGRLVYFCHLPAPAMEAAASGNYDAVFFGHTHKVFTGTSGRTLVVNPGEVYGRQGAPTIGIYNTEDNSARIICI